MNEEEVKWAADFAAVCARLKACLDLRTPIVLTPDEALALVKALRILTKKETN